MKKLLPFILLWVTVLLIQSCATPKYIHDESSHKRQKELRNCRSSNVFCDVLAGVGYVFMGVMLETDIGFDISEQQFKKLNLVNTSPDTMYVNMLTDVIWDTEDYCDFMDIRIPPGLNCKVMVPLNANYNLYFSDTPESEDDEMIEIFTNDIKKSTYIRG